MNQPANFYFSSKYRLLYLSITFSFLILFFLLNRSFVFLLFFVNMLYIYIAYINKPTLTITDNELIQNGFYFKKMKIIDLIDIVINNTSVVFISENNALKVNLNYVDSDSKIQLFNFIDNQTVNGNA
jgi:hypothetical protein